MSRDRTLELKEIEGQEAIVVPWMEEKLGEKIPKKPFRELIWDGVLLCRLANVLKPGCVRKMNRNAKSKMQQIENGTFFLQACKTRLGLPESSLFQTSDIQDETEETGLTALRKILAVLLQLRKEHPGSDGDATPAEVHNNNTVPSTTSQASLERVAVASHYAQSAADFGVQTSSQTTGDDIGLQYIAGNSVSDNTQSTIYGIIIGTIHESLSAESKKSLYLELRTEVRSLQSRLMSATDEELRVIAHEYGLGNSLADVPTDKGRKWYLDWIIQHGRKG